MVLQHTLKIVILYGRLQTVITFLIFLTHANIGHISSGYPDFSKANESKKSTEAIISFNTHDIYNRLNINKKVRNEAVSSFVADLSEEKNNMEKLESKLYESLVSNLNSKLN